jgi:hypothetical protein
VELLPSEEGTPVRTPDRALARAVELAEGYRDTIGELEKEGMTVIGDAGMLTEAYPGAAEPRPAPALVPVETAVQAILGVVSRSSSGNAFFPDEVAEGLGEQDGLPGSARTPQEITAIETLSAREISEVLAGRVRKGMQRRYRQERRRLTRIAHRGKLTPHPELEDLVPVEDGPGRPSSTDRPQ